MLWKKLLSVGGSPIDPITHVTRSFLHKAVLIRALGELGSDAIRIEQPMPDQLYEYLTSTTSLQDCGTVLFLADRVEYWLSCLEEELIAAPVREPATQPRRALSNAVLQKERQGKKRKQEDVDAEGASGNSNNSCVVC